MFKFEIIIYLCDGGLVLLVSLYRITRKFKDKLVWFNESLNITKGNRLQNVAKYQVIYKTFVYKNYSKLQKPSAGEISSCALELQLLVKFKCV